MIETLKQPLHYTNHNTINSKCSSPPRCLHHSIHQGSWLGQDVVKVLPNTTKTMFEYPQ